METVKCPNCGYVIAIDLSDEASGYLTNEDEVYKKECANCGYAFEYLVKTAIHIAVKEA